MKLILNIIFILRLGAVNSYKFEEYKKLYQDSFKRSSEWIPPTDNSEYAPFNKKCSHFGTYDFIIVGGGTAGAVVANRLSANGTYSILLLEAGGEESEINQIPGNYLPTIFSDSNWGYMTVSQRNLCLSSKSRQCLYSRGRVLGGSSSINGMTYARGSKEDFDKWASMGNKGWSYEEVLPYFIKSENSSSFNGDKGYHGYNGPFHIIESIQKIYQDIIVKAHNEMELETIDYNGKNYIGISNPQTSVKNGRRMSTNRAYLEPIRKIRKNLKILTHSLVTNIKFTNKEAKKVKFINNRSCLEAKVKREIIIAAGSINSPQLLLLSGVGPKEELSKFNIHTIKNLPVGKFFEDHPTIESDIIIRTNLIIHYNSFNDLIKDTLLGKGRLVDGPILNLSFLGSSNYTRTPNFENIFIIRDYCTIRDNDDNKPSQKAMDLVVVPVLYKTKSKGGVTLKSANPIDFPKIDPNYFSQLDDLDKMYKIIISIIDLLDTKAMKNINATLSDETTKIPECKKIDENNIYDEKYWKCFIRHKGSVGLHASGTCRMGNNAIDSVVDSSLKIHGLKNVRIVDASVFPKLPVGHPVASVIMLAEKASDIIITDNRNIPII